MSVSDLALDPVSHDLLLESGRARLATGAAAVAQLWKAHLTLFKGETFLDRNKGIDYQGQVLIKGARPAVVRSIFAQASRETPCVAEVSKLDLSLDPAKRVLSVTAEVVLEDGAAVTLSTTQSVGG